MSITTFSKHINAQVILGSIGLGVIYMTHRNACTRVMQEKRIKHRQSLVDRLIQIPLIASATCDNKTMDELTIEGLTFSSTAFDIDFTKSPLINDRSLYPIWKFLTIVQEAANKFNPRSNQLMWDLSVSEISGLNEEIMEVSQAMLDHIASIPKDQHTFMNTISPMMEMHRVLHPLVNNLDFLAHVAEDKAIRDISTKVCEKYSAWNVQMNMRIDVFEAVKSFSETEEAKNLDVKSEEYRIIKDMMDGYKRSGLDLPIEKRKSIEEILTRMGQLSILFAKNLGEENTTLYFTKEELLGLTEDFLGSLEYNSDDKKYKLTLAYPHYNAIMQECKIPSTRKSMEAAFNSRCIIENTPIIEELIVLRHKKAQLLGFDNHAQFILKKRMAKDPKHVIDFLTELNNKLEGASVREMNELKELKLNDMANDYYDLDKDDTDIKPYDYRYYMTQLEKKKYSVDNELIKQYFPLEVVTEGLLSMYQTLLSLKFELVENAATWHEDVKLYNVYDMSNENETKEEIFGQFYLDLFPRKGKFGHAACFTLAADDSSQENGHRDFPIAAMVANFPKPSNDKPSLLPHDQVNTYFHEFGHVMHDLCGKVKYATHSGAGAVERDFVEAPSQMLENWVFEKEALKILSCHYETKETLPDDLITALIAARDASAALKCKRQLVFGILDQTLHSQAKADTAAEYKRIQKDILGIEASPNTNMVASFGHLAGGYDAQYYGYMYSDVFAMDMFMSKFKLNGILNPQVGMEYRKLILERGGSVDAIDMLKEFLGREPNQEAFLKSKHLI